MGSPEKDDAESQVVMDDEHPNVSAASPPPDGRDKRSRPCQGESNHDPSPKRKAPSSCQTRATADEEDGFVDDKNIMLRSNDAADNRLEDFDEEHDHSIDRLASGGAMQSHDANEGDGDQSKVCEPQQPQPIPVMLPPPGQATHEQHNQAGDSDASSPALSNYITAGLGDAACMQGIPTNFSFSQNAVQVQQQSSVQWLTNSQGITGGINLPSTSVPQPLNRTLIPSPGFGNPLIMSSNNLPDAGCFLNVGFGNPNQEMQQQSAVLPPQQQHMDGMAFQQNQQVVFLNHGQLAGSASTLPPTQEVGMLGQQQQVPGLAPMLHQQQAQQLTLPQMQQTIVVFPQPGHFSQNLSSPQMQLLHLHNQLALSYNISNGSSNNRLVQPNANSNTSASSAGAGRQGSTAQASTIPQQTNDATQSDRMLMYISTDDEVLSEYQALLRKNIEFFEATRKDLRTTTPGRKKPIVLGQVGIRCIHCASLPAYRRTSASVYFPRKLGRLYQSAQNIGLIHFLRSCQSLDDELRVTIQSFHTDGNKPTAGHGGKVYWSKAATAKGVVETEESGLRLCNKEEIDSPDASAFQSTF